MRTALDSIDWSRNYMGSADVPRFGARWLGALVISGVCAALVACKANDSVRAPEATPSAALTAAEAAPPAQLAEAAASPSAASAPSIYALTMKRLDGTETALSAWSGKVVLIVNTASKCGYTPQYRGLQELHAKYEPRGFAVLGFPSNDFGGQEPGSAKEIADFCISMYDVNFPMFEKTKTTGQDKSALYALLSEAKGEPKWNFHKYLIDKQGRPVEAWPSAVEPGAAQISSAIEAQLAAQ